ncbi:MAG: hypothetical protein KAR44_03335 [Candidatus Aegiribacteria sp.]|nr:hypothetical protein [Candidatus Aegiribacteria sp.]
MKRIIMVVVLLSSIASALDTSGWYTISELGYCILSPSDIDDCGADPFRYCPDIEFSCSSDILKCEFNFTTRDTCYPVHWMTDQAAFFYIEAPGASLYFLVIDHDIVNPDAVYPDSVSTDFLTANETNTITFQDGSTITFYLEHIIDPYIYW